MGTIPIPMTTAVARERLPAGKPGAVHPAFAGQRLDGGAQPHVDAPAAMHVEQPGGEFGRERPPAKPVERFHHRDLGAQHAGRGGDFEADPAAADDDQLRPLAEILPDRLAVVDAAQIVDPVELRPLDGEPADPAAGGDQQLAVRDAAAIRQRDRPGRTVDRGRRHAGPELDPQLVERALGPEIAGIRRLLPQQDLFRQGRALVGRVGLLADHDDAALEALVAQRPRRPATGLAGADHDDRRIAHRTEVPGARSSPVRRPGCRRRRS